MADNFSLKFDGDLIADIDKLGAALRAHVFRSVAHAGAVELYNEVRHLVPVKTGRLRDSIYRVFAEDLSDETTKVYEISWNHTKAPHGWLVENGHLQKVKVNGQQVLKQTTAAGFIRRASDRMGAAVQAMEERAVVRVQEVLTQNANSDALPDIGAQG